MQLLADREKATRTVVINGAKLLIACLLSSGLSAQQKGHHLAAAEREHVLDGPYKVVATTESIPADIRQAFSQLTRESSFAMANPGQKYQASDVVVDRGLPFRRLVFAGVSNGKWFIHYERGGIGHGYYIVLFRVDPYGTHFLWGGSGANGAKNLEQLRKLIADAQISDAGDY